MRRVGLGCAWSGAVLVNHAAHIARNATCLVAGALEPAPGYLLARMQEMREFAEGEMPAVTLVE